MEARPSPHAPLPSPAARNTNCLTSNNELSGLAYMNTCMNTCGSYIHTYILCMTMRPPCPPSNFIFVLPGQFARKVKLILLDLEPETLRIGADNGGWGVSRRPTTGE